ncbi:hypothetical protein HAX54_001258, partial [Datura stramonium]|nr:hypothetical protein [Datura stramonium]
MGQRVQGNKELVLWKPAKEKEMGNVHSGSKKAKMTMPPQQNKETWSLEKETKRSQSCKNQLNCRDSSYK